jgi:Hypoxia induced protein conserved region
MPSLSGSIVGVAMLLVVVALAAGLVNMMRGGSPNRSQMLMRWRVGLQFAAIVAIMAALYIRRH